MAKKTETTVAVSFSVENLLRSSEFTNIEKDMLGVLLKDGQEYTIEEAKQLLQKESERVIG